MFKRTTLRDATAGPGPAGPTAHPGLIGPTAHPAPIGPTAHPAPIGPTAHPALIASTAHAALIGPTAHAAPSGPTAHAALIGSTAHAAPSASTAHAAHAASTAHAAPSASTAHSNSMGSTTHSASMGSTAHAASMSAAAHSAAMRSAARPGLIGLAWLAVCMGLGMYAASRGAEAQAWGLVPAAHRPAPEHALLVRLEDDAPDEALGPALTALERLPGREPLAPPPAEARRWLDAHALSLLPREHHPALADRLAPDALQATIAGAHARLTSPFAGLVSDDLRRDPLSLDDLAGPGLAGRLGFLSSNTTGGPEVSERGDLVALDRRRALLLFRSGTSTQELRDSAAVLVAAHPVELAVVGGPARDETATAALAAAPRILTSLVAALTFVLAFAFRRVRPVLALILTVLGPAALLAALVAPLGLFDLPLVVLAVGLAAAPARPDSTIAALTALALVPLVLAPYPVWHPWALAWGAALVAAGLARRLVQPRLMAWLGCREDDRAPLAPPEPPPLRLPTALAATLAALSILILGTWSSKHVRFDSPSPIALADPKLAAAEAEVAAEFFRPEDVALVASPGDDPEAALARAADDLRPLLALVPAAIERLDAPGAFVVAEPELQARLEGLQALDIRGRLDVLRLALVAHGMRPGAFGEFIRSAADDLTVPPSPAAALAGPLGPWLHGKVGPEGVVTRAYLAPADTAPPPRALAADGRPLELRGPGVFARDERARFSARTGSVLAAGAWLSALVVWLSTRRLALALALGLSAVVAECGLLVVLHLLGRSFGPIHLPIFLLAGAAAVVAGLRAVRALAAGRPWLDPGRLANALGPLAAALALIAAPEPVWRALGLTAALAVLVAHSVGGILAPHLYSLIARAARGRG